jgi:endonuclease/exonuclease/phosphatase family metal-dependent hydrolase
MHDAPLLGPAEAPDLAVMTLNVRRIVPHLRPRHPDRWSRRRPALTALLEQERPSVLGLQEAQPAHLRAALEALDGYAVLGTGRSRRGGDEANPILVDTDRLEVERWRQLALSTTPHRPGSRSWGAMFPRILVEARLRDRITGVRWQVVNTHLDHVSPLARRRSAALIRALLDDGPAVVTGDANAGTGSPAYRTLVTRGPLRDAVVEAQHPIGPRWGTRPAYRRPTRGRRIDWLLVGGGVVVREAGMNDAKPGGRWPSDHLPVQALLRATDGGGS